MRARLAFALALVGLLFGASAIPAHAADDTPYLTYQDFWSPVLCMAIGDFTIEAPEMAQAWNVQSDHIMQISAKNNCVTAGYPPSRRFTIDTYAGSTSRCYILTDKNTEILSPGADLTENNGHWQYIDNPIVWINRNCYNTFAARRHYTSAGIGELLGLQRFNSAGMNSRVMNMTSWSVMNVDTADPYSGAVLARLYS